LKLKSLLSTLCGVLAALALFGIMMLTLVDVSGRKLLSTSVPGSLELTELLLVVVIFAGLPLVSLQRRTRGVRFARPAAAAPGCGGAAGAGRPVRLRRALLGVAWLMWTKGSQMIEYGDTTAQLKLPLGPFVYLMSVLCAVTAAVHGLLALQPDDSGVDAPARP
jgi:TRAP-type C4-dicarboxylate transport system permease small subunit